MLEITLIRHAPTSYNHGDTFMGILDVPPDEIKLKELVGKNIELSNRKFDRIYSSPLKRASFTASLLFPETDIIEDPRLIEKNLGSWAGMSKNQVRIRYPEAFLPDGHLNPLFTPPGGENFDTMVERIAGFLKDLITGYQTGGRERAAVITHNGVIRTIRHIVNGHPVQEIFSKSEPFVEPIRLVYKDKWEMTD